MIQRVIDDGMRSYYEQRAAEYDDWWLGTGLFVERDRPGWHQEVEQLIAIVQALPAARVLDVACGTGFLTRHLQGEITGIDQSVTMVELAAERLPGARVLTGDAVPLPFANGEFDRIFTSHFYGHLLPGERESFLLEARRVGRQLVIVDSAARPGVGVDQRQERVLNDGSRHVVYKRFFTGDQLADEIGGGQVLHHGDWFVVVTSSGLSRFPSDRIRAAGAKPIAEGSRERIDGVESSTNDPDVSGAATVMVVGSASVRIAPDEAFVFLTLTKTEPAAGAALTDVASRGDALAALLDELAVPQDDRSTTGITVNEEFDHTKDGRRALGYRATTTLSIRLADMKLIGTVVMRCTEELDARIVGPSWRVSPDNPAWLDAASRAAANARAKAAAYAAGLDLKLGALLALAEPTDAHATLRRAEVVKAGETLRCRI
jgi:demethylmenaquinone methyltransferase/2-methoxy-6-polyprenyl-1,4-benzoquinol methylase